MKNYKLSKKTSLIILSLILILTISLFQSYNKYYLYYTEVVFPSTTDKGFGAMNATDNITMEEADPTFNQTKVYASLKPGESYTGKIAIKNLDPRSEYTLSAKPFTSENNKDANKQTPTIEINEPDFFLNKGEFAIKEFTIQVPLETTTNINYTSTIGAHSLTALNNQTKAKTKISIQASILILLEVSNTPQTYQYKDNISNPRHLAMKHVYNRARQLLALLLAILAIHFAKLSRKKK